MMTWKRGKELIYDKLHTNGIDLQGFLQSVLQSPPTRVEGTAVFMTSDPNVVPTALLHNLKHNKVLHEQNIFVNIVYHELPWIGMDKRTSIEPLGGDCWRVQLNYGFKNDVDVPTALQLLRPRGCDTSPMSTSYFLSRDVFVPTDKAHAGMAPWRQKLFAQMHHNAAGAAEFLLLPSNSLVELGSKIEI